MDIEWQQNVEQKINQDHKTEKYFIFVGAKLKN